MVIRGQWKNEKNKNKKPRLCAQENLVFSSCSISALSSFFLRVYISFYRSYLLTHCSSFRNMQRWGIKIHVHCCMIHNISLIYRQPTYAGCVSYLKFRAYSFGRPGMPFSCLPLRPADFVSGFEVQPWSMEKWCVVYGLICPVAIRILERLVNQVGFLKSNTGHFQCRHLFVLFGASEQGPCGC